jgi:hypothetical protein
MGRGSQQPDAEELVSKSADAAKCRYGVYFSAARSGDSLAWHDELAPAALSLYSASAHGSCRLEFGLALGPLQAARMTDRSELHTDLVLPECPFQVWVLEPRRPATPPMTAHNGVDLETGRRHSFPESTSEARSFNDL